MDKHSINWKLTPGIQDSILWKSEQDKKFRLGNYWFSIKKLPEIDTTTLRDCLNFYRMCSDYIFPCTKSSYSALFRLPSGRVQTKKGRNKMLKRNLVSHIVSFKKLKNQGRIQVKPNDNEINAFIQMK